MKDIEIQQMKLIKNIANILERDFSDKFDKLEHTMRTKVDINDMHTKHAKPVELAVPHITNNVLGKVKDVATFDLQSNESLQNIIEQNATKVVSEALKKERVGTVATGR